MSVTKSRLSTSAFAPERGHPAAALHQPRRSGSSSAGRSSMSAASHVLQLGGRRMGVRQLLAGWTLPPGPGSVRFSGVFTWIDLRGGPLRGGRDGGDQISGTPSGCWIRTSFSRTISSRARKVTTTGAAAALALEEAGGRSSVSPDPRRAVMPCIAAERSADRAPPRGPTRGSSARSTRSSASISLQTGTSASGAGSRSRGAGEETRRANTSRPGGRVSESSRAASSVLLVL